MAYKKKVALGIFLLTIFLCIGGYAAYKIYLSYDAYAKGDRTYQQIAQQVIVEEEEFDQSYDKINIPKREVNFSVLKSINENSIGWLYCPDTVIDYPVVAADDYTYYLSHLPDGTYNINGTLFLDYNCTADFSDGLSVIYGHSMKTGKMFGTLEKYKKQSYFEKHPYLYLYTETQNYRIALIYGAVVSAEQWIKEKYAQDANALLKYAKANTTFASPVKCSDNQKLVALSTCSYEYNGARYFVIGILQPD